MHACEGETLRCCYINQKQHKRPQSQVEMPATHVTPWRGLDPTKQRRGALSNRPRVCTVVRQAQPEVIKKLERLTVVRGRSISTTMLAPWVERCIAHTQVCSREVNLPALPALSRKGMRHLISGLVAWP